MRTHVALLGTLACLSCVPDPEFPEVGAWTMSGPGGPNVSFQDTDLYEPCAVLSGGPEDAQEHNLVGMLDGYLLMPWAPEDAGGGISFYDFSDPCAPEEVGKAVLPSMRETHTLATGWVDGRRFLAVDSMDPEDTSVGGVGFVDITDPAAPFWVSEIALPEFNYPDAYFFVTLSAFWLGDVLYVPMGFAGVVVLDVSDVTAPKHVTTLPPDTLLTGSFHVIGNRAMLSNAGMTLTRFYDVSDPLMPIPVPGGEWSVTDGDGRQIPYYFANMGGKYALFARKGDGGGPVVFDVSRPDAPTFVGHLHQPDAAGGYIFRHHDHLFQGEGDYGAVYSMENPTQIREVGRFSLPGDLDTVTPVGNVAVVSVDHGAQENISTTVVPWQTDSDARGPTAELHFPVDGEVFVGARSAVGISFDEAILDSSVFSGSMRVWTHKGEAVPGRFYVQENIVNFVADAPWPEDTTIHVHVPEGGISDVSGNAILSPLSFSFATGPELR